ncbi:MAG: ExbD/TolR family protein [Rubripirellula sp.]
MSPIEAAHLGGKKLLFTSLPDQHGFVMSLPIRYDASMRVPSTHNRRSVGANMTPMIDVVFLLIIFFLVSSHLARQENRLPLNLPVASTFDPLDPERAPLTISINAEAKWLIGGDVVDLEALRSVLSDLRIRRGAEASVRIRTDGMVHYQYVEPVLREAALAGVTDATIAVREEER